MANEAPSTLFNINQAAFILRVHPLTIRRYIKEGRLKAIRAGGNIRVRESDLADFQKDVSPKKRGTTSSFGKQKNNPVKIFTEDDPFLKLDGRAASFLPTK